MHACVFVGRAKDDVWLAVELPVMESVNGIEDDRVEPCKRVTFVEVARLEADEEDEVLAMTVVVGKMAVVLLRVAVVV